MYLSIAASRSHEGLVLYYFGIAGTIKVSDSPSKLKNITNELLKSYNSQFLYYNYGDRVSYTEIYTKYKSNILGGLIHAHILYFVLTCKTK